MSGSVVSLASRRKIATSKEVAHWINLFEHNVRKLKEIAASGDAYHLAQLTESFMNDLRSMQEALRMQSPEDEFTSERDRLRRLRIQRDKKKLGL
jgi:mevalonate pyrophosphate decarboxylase